MHARRSTPGRPPKYGRPARVVHLTLPEDVLEWLTTIHEDPAWAIVTICEREFAKGPDDASMPPAAELVRLPEGDNVIAFKPDTIRDIEGLSIIPWRDGRALVALKDGNGIADLELAIVDKLESKRLSSCQRPELEKARKLLREWRQKATVRFQSRSIIVANGSGRRKSRENGESKPSAPRTRKPLSRTLTSWFQAFNVAAVHQLAEIAQHSTALI